MKTLLVRSIPLSKETRDAWRSLGYKFLKRTSDFSKVEKNFQRIINLGNMTLPPASGEVWNHPDTVRAVNWPESLRNTMPDFLPAMDWNGPHWHKGHGYGGNNKEFHPEFDAVRCWLPGDVQTHIEGAEYRVNTVGRKIIQVHEKIGVHSGFQWNWVGVQSLKKTGLYPMMKEAMDYIPLIDSSILGWDVRRGEDKWYVLEINTCPGLNVPTAKRIGEAIDNSNLLASASVD